MSVPQNIIQIYVSESTKGGKIEKQGIFHGMHYWEWKYDSLDMIFDECTRNISDKCNLYIHFQ